MKYVSLIIIPLIIVIMFTGCWDNEEYENMALVRSISFDVDKDGEFVLTTEYVKSKKKDRYQEKVGDIRTVKGRTAVEAMDNMQKELQHELFLGYITTVIISEEAAEKQMQNIIDFLYITPNIRDSVYIVISKGKASDLITETGSISEKLVGEQIQDFFKSLPRTGIAFSVRLTEFIKMILSEGLEPILPAVEVTKGNIKVSEMVIFKGYKPVGLLDENESRGWGWIKGKKLHPLVSIYVRLPNEEKPILTGFKLRESRTKIKVKIENGLPEIYISVKIIAGTQSFTDYNKFITPEILAACEKELANYIKKDIESAIIKIQKNLHSDVLGIGMKVHQQHRKEWKGVYEKKWDEIFPNIPIYVDVKATIQNSGMVIIPLLEK